MYDLSLFYDKIDFVENAKEYIKNYHHYKLESFLGTKSI